MSAKLTWLPMNPVNTPTVTLSLAMDAILSSVQLALPAQSKWLHQVLPFLLP